MSFLAGMVLLPFGRWLWRQWLNRQRQRGAYQHRTVVFGSRANCEHTAAQLARHNGGPYTLLGVIVDDDSTGPLPPDIPLLGHGDPVELALAAGADTVIYAGSDSHSHDQRREFGWEIEAVHMDLLVAPGLTDVAGPRLTAHTVAGLPLVSVDYPTLTGLPRFLKRCLDIIGSALILLFVSLPLLVVAILIKVTSPGPVIFTQERIGLNGKPFRVFKFRTMVADAESRMPELIKESQEDTTVFFKPRNDPRITRIGRVLRRFSIDEFPQFLNVLRGNMSLVGPRPQVAREVSEYDEWTRRRLLVKPGVTGLWQVSGRNDLSVEDSIRLDLYYVENWSLAGDFVILFRTINAVLHPAGAY
jgi:exopolysaccharide biosynthesis polyprenyl glycosylphosphotransferase